MSLLRLPAVNAEISRRGIAAELVRGNGYLYFVGSDVDAAPSTSVAVCRLNHLSLSQWMAALDGIVADAKARS